MYGLIKQLVLPPTPLLLAALAGVMLARTRPRLGLRLAGVSLGLLWLLGLPPIADELYRLAGRGGPPPAEGPAGAVVVLGADWVAQPGEFSLGAMSLERLRHGARVARREGLPILLAGGSPPEVTPVAVLMADSLAADFGMAPGWIESRSQDTAENARFAAEILRFQGIRTVVLVTSAFHMPRARQAFERQGIATRPDPSGARAAPALHGLYSLLPSAAALHRSHYAVHEGLGRLWYALVHGD
ncbi:MAG: YdcF family protein [Alphaproteobacteria bacterium]|nr:YdcF family protein [Alphaproteobacteria bacterium]